MINVFKRPSVICNVQAQARGRASCILHTPAGGLSCYSYRDDRIGNAYNIMTYLIMFVI